MQTSRLVHYMILIHVVGLSIANRFLQIGWQKKYVDQFQANIDYQAKDLVAIVVRDAQV